MNPGHVALLGTIRADLALTGETAFRQQALLKMMLDLSFNGATEQDVINAEFIVKARLVHGQKYDYSRVEYKNNLTKVTITCPTHGDFEQGPKNHLRGDGCPACGGKQKSDTAGFIKKAEAVHGPKYDYTAVEYKNNEVKVTITCPTHGDFEQAPSNHLKGQGCPACGGTQRENTAGFIKKAEAVHGLKYDYAAVEYVSNKAKVKIICREHGLFEQVPSSHLFGKGCQACSHIKRAATRKQRAAEKQQDQGCPA